ncbi:MAG: hypothetical protein BZ136_07510 [Methanosphaera sp. rholeuAM74]|nr:MAG: hypothetical protein BZ136_07510 [Methanosphaera sp. rholeuAM74]
MAEEKKDEKKEDKKEERKKVYTPMWQQENPSEHRVSGDMPDIHLYVSFQKRGTEDAAQPYTTQQETADKKKESTTDNTNNSNTATGNTSTGTNT